MAELEGWFAAMEAQGHSTLKEADLNTRKVVVQRGLDMRYVGQEHAVTVDLPASAFRRGAPEANKAAIKAAFDAAHEERYGRGSPSEMAEIVSIRSTVIGVMKHPTLEKIAKGGARPPAAALRGKRRAYFEDGGWVQAAVVQREALLAGNRISGPALIEEHATTTVLQPGDRLIVEPYGNLDISIGRK